MRRIATWLLVAAVAALGLAAAVDALRGEGERVVAAPAAAVVPDRAEESETAARQLREAGIVGVLTYSDEDCRLHAVSLPELEPVEAPSFEMCRPDDLQRRARGRRRRRRLVGPRLQGRPGGALQRGALACAPGRGIG